MEDVLQAPQLAREGPSAPAAGVSARSSVQWCTGSLFLLLNSLSQRARPLCSETSGSPLVSPVSTGSLL